MLKTAVCAVPRRNERDPAADNHADQARDYRNIRQSIGVKGSLQTFSEPGRTWPHRALPLSGVLVVDRLRWPAAHRLTGCIGRSFRPGFSCVKNASAASKLNPKSSCGAIIPLMFGSMIQYPPKSIAFGSRRRDFCSAKPWRSAIRRTLFSLTLSMPENIPEDMLEVKLRPVLWKRDPGIAGAPRL